MISKLKSRLGLTASFILFLFIIMMAAMLIASILILLAHYTGLISFFESSKPQRAGGLLRLIFAMMLLSTFLGISIIAFFSKKALKPVRILVEATHQVSEGDFSVQIDLKDIPELQELSHSFNKMVHELSSIEAMRVDFINNFSHEFKTPIVSIKGFARLLKEGNLNEDEQREYLDIIIAESERLASLSTNVLNLSKYETIGIVQNKTTYRLDEQIRRVIAMTETLWSEKKLVMDVEMEALFFDADEDLMQQLWLNLIDNAIKFSNPDGTISIRLNAWNGGILFTIKDHGIGMDEKILPHIFERFYQGDTSHTHMGNGLGLSIVKRIVELFEGDIEVQSRLGSGSLFKVSFHS